ARVPFLAPLYVKQPLLAVWYQVNQPVFEHQYGAVAGAALSRFEKWVARLHSSATILTPSQARRADLVNLGFRPEQIFAVPPVAIDASTIDPPDISDRPP